MPDLNDAPSLLVGALLRGPIAGLAAIGFIRWTRRPSLASPIAALVTIGGGGLVRPAARHPYGELVPGDQNGDGQAGAEVAPARVATTDADAFLLASRALLGVANRSLSHLEGTVSPAQFRLLLAVSELGTVPSSRAAQALGVGPSTVTRLGDRLVARGYLVRRTGETSRRLVTLELTESARELVLDVLDRRRTEIARALAKMTAVQRRAAAAGLSAFAAALGEGYGEQMSGPEAARVVV